MRFFKLFIKNKNLIKPGLYLLEIFQKAAGSTDLATDRHGHDGPSWTPSSHTSANTSASLLHYPRRQVWWTVIGTTVRRGSSFQNTSTLGIWVLDHFSELHDEPSGRTVTSFITPHLVRLPHLPSEAALRCHLRTITSMMDRHKLRRGSLLHFFTLKPPHSSLAKFPANKDKTYIKISTKSLLETLNLRKKY